MFKYLNIWFISSLLVSIFVIIPILTVFMSFFENTSNYYELLKDTFLIEYILNSSILLLSVLILTFLIGTGSAYLVSFYEFPLGNFFKWALILSFAVPPYIYAYSLTAFFENYGTAFTILKNIFGDGNYNKSIPKLDGMLGAILSISFSLFAYVYILTRASFLYQSQNLIELGKNLGFTKFKSFYKIILPQMLRLAIPNLSNVWQITLKDTSLISVTGLVEIMRQSYIAAGSTRDPLFFYSFAAVLYLLLTFLSMKLINKLEVKYSRGY